MNSAKTCKDGSLLHLIHQDQRMYVIKFTPGFEEISLNNINVGNKALKLRLLNNFLSKFPQILLLSYDRCLVDKIPPWHLSKSYCDPLSESI